MNPDRYEATRALDGWRIMDRHTGMFRGFHTYFSENAARLAAARLNQGVFTPKEITMPTGYGPLTTYTANFHIFKRSTQVPERAGFRPTSVSVPSALSEKGAKTALEHFFERQGHEGAAQHGMWLVYSPVGAWVFEVTAPEPAPNVITVR